MMGFPEGWTEGERNPRLRCYGNAVVPQCASVAWQHLLERIDELERAA